MFINNSKRR